MHIERLTEENVFSYIKYLKAAFSEEPDMMTAGSVCEEEIVMRVRQGAQSVSLLAIEGGETIGRLEYHSYDCLQDGYKMAYVNWVYVRRAHRQKGVARKLFEAFEKECAASGVNEYFLIQAKNEGARRFYGSFAGAVSSDERILRKTLPTK